MKPFKESEAGKWIIKNVPSLINTVEGFVPAPIKGAMDVLKNLIGVQPQLTTAQIDEFNKLAEEYEQMLILDVQNAREISVKMQSDVIVPLITKLRPTLISLTVTAIWASMTVYIIANVLGFVKRDPSSNLESVLALYAGLSTLFSQVLTFEFGSSAGSKAKQYTIDNIAKS